MLDATVYPRLPTRIEGAGGKVEVILKARPRADGAEVWGSWDESRRIIEIERTAGRRHQWQTYYHEWTHAAFGDAGLDNLMTDAMVEALCAAVATARMRERFG